MKTKKVHSFYDSKNLLYVDCAECERGGNGSDKDKCGAGWQIKRSKGLGCFAGTLMPAYAEALRNKQKEAA